MNGPDHIRKLLPKIWVPPQRESLCLALKEQMANELEGGSEPQGRPHSPDTCLLYVYVPIHFLSWSWFSNKSLVNVCETSVCYTHMC
jgi:hypothetical protein